MIQVAKEDEVKEQKMNDDVNHIKPSSSSDYMEKQGSMGNEGIQMMSSFTMAKANGISSLSKSAASPRSRMGRKDGMGAPSVDMQSTSSDATSSIGLRSPIGLQMHYDLPLSLLCPTGIVNFNLDFLIEP
jgi:hypothetical protein